MKNKQTHANAHTRTHTHARTHTRTHARMHARTRAHTHTHAHTHVHTHTHTYTHTHTLLRSNECALKMIRAGSDVHHRLTRTIIYMLPFGEMPDTLVEVLTHPHRLAFDGRLDVRVLQELVGHSLQRIVWPRLRESSTHGVNCCLRTHGVNWLPRDPWGYLVASGPMRLIGRLGTHGVNWLSQDPWG